MPGKKLNLTPEEIAAPFAGAWGDRYPVILSPAQFAELLGLSVKTIYDWIAFGRLDGAFRKRGKHILLWRDRALELVLIGKEWVPCPTTKTESKSATA